jgi:hypothetical protein
MRILLIGFRVLQLLIWLQVLQLLGGAAQRLPPSLR